MTFNMFSMLYVVGVLFVWFLCVWWLNKQIHCAATFCKSINHLVINNSIFVFCPHCSMTHNSLWSKAGATYPKSHASSQLVFIHYIYISHICVTFSLSNWRDENISWDWETRHLISTESGWRNIVKELFLISVSLCTDQAGPFVIRDKKSQGGLVADLAHKLGHRVCTTLPGVQTSFQEPVWCDVTGLKESGDRITTPRS